MGRRYGAAGMGKLVLPHRITDRRVEGPQKDRETACIVNEG